LHNDNRAPGPAPRVALAVGDTAGHAHPALAVAEAFRDRDPSARILFLGTADSIAARILAREGETLTGVPGAPLRRAGLLGVALALTRTFSGIRASRGLLARHEITFAIGFGGFASGGVLLGARSIGIRTAIHEANVEMGLANILLRPFVDDLFLTHAETDSRGLEVGLPMRRTIRALAPGARTPPAGALRVLVTSGSRGVEFLTAVMPPVLAAVRQAGISVEVRQQTAEVFLDDMADAYRWADVAIARSGANTVAELALAGLPALLVPLKDAAANHQMANARRWTLAGAGPLVEQARWDGAFVAQWLRLLAANPWSWRNASDGARSLAHADAARLLVEHCATVMQGRW